MTSVQGIIGKKQFRTEIKSDSGHTLISDEPESLGGANEGFDPLELLASSLVSCTCATLRMYADRKGWDIPEIKVSVTIEQDEISKITNIKRKIRMPNISDESMLKRMLDIANKCPVHKLFSGEIEIATEIGNSA